MNQNSSLISWIGGNDIDAHSVGKDGPILSTLQNQNFQEVHLLYNYDEQRISQFVSWLTPQTSAKIITYKAQLSSPIHFGEIYVQAHRVLDLLASQNIHPDILLSPGTPAMQAVWILLGKTKFQTRFIQASIEQGIQFVEIPFEIAAEYTPPIQSLSNHTIELLSTPKIPTSIAFDEIITRNPKIVAIKKKAEILAGVDVPILIYGESGTGKELFARAIHNHSKSPEKPFIAVNCGALPAELIDSLLFGHKKGAFTGANHEHLGFFREAEGGSIFLDEFGELPPNAQVRLLRVLQEKKITPVGSSHEISINVRVITATHKNLIQMVADGSFREDLFYRIAVGVLEIPPIREREGDLLLLAEKILDQLKAKEASLNHKSFSVSAKNVILKHQWLGNVRELHSTVMRAALWSVGDEINGSDIKNALFKIPTSNTINGAKDISQGIDINNEISVLAKKYIQEALVKTGNNKTKAAELLGLKNYQTLNYWIEKYNLGK